MEDFGNGTCPRKFFEKTLDKLHKVCYNIIVPREQEKMKEVKKYDY
jgi:hypothetical protein